MLRARLLFSTATLLVLFACTGGDGDDTDAGDDAGEVDAGPVCPENLPPPSDACLEGQCGNSLGVGRPCTEEGGECSSLIDEIGSGAAIFCTADFDPTPLQFCTRPCVTNAQCGENATCAIDPSDPDGQAGCVPDSCYDGPPVDAGPDPDAGDDSADAG